MHQFIMVILGLLQLSFEYPTFRLRSYCLTNCAPAAAYLCCMCLHNYKKLLWIRSVVLLFYTIIYNKKWIKYLTFVAKFERKYFRMRDLACIIQF